jgi:hypothetical protein
MNWLNKKGLRTKGAGQILWQPLQRQQQERSTHYLKEQVVIMSLLPAASTET